jgi:hypothetical protein
LQFAVFGFQFSILLTIGYCLCSMGSFATV